ncbi:isocitrate lyase family protein-like protein [Mollisia scopiformis]|uniref:Isocitrate lyase family protein-like protein n=1 Tax=Mollisia scopiformis TaxID=149040 RepID=A0A194XX57_MOLSC|nr:isocitrate lyase family protein-like protein [Mollisia scopiformis]KUJ24372.1 isocitrate lyase family protein-like protein [Mollisia scopiformis]
MAPPPSPASKLRAMLANEKEIIVCPGVYDGFTARLALNAGFEVLYMTGAGTTMSKLGHADLGIATQTDMVSHASMLASLSPSTPLIADADTGYGGPLKDQVVNKRCGHLKNKELVDLDTWISRIRAAVMAREESGGDIVIIARTDALAGQGYEEASKRLRAAVEVGADVAFLEGVRSVEEARRFCGEMSGVPCLYNCVPGGVSPVLSVKEGRDCGFRVVITPTLALGAVFESVSEAYRKLLEEGDTERDGVPVRRLFESCGLEESVEFDVRAGGKLYENGV